MLIELRARRTMLHGLALLAVIGLCWTISTIALLSITQDGLPGAPQHLAYGYLYFPVLAAPIIASWTSSPWHAAVPIGSPRHSRVQAACLLGIGSVLALAALGIARRSQVPGAAQAAIENTVLVVSLIAILRPVLGREWCTLAVVAYGSFGLFLPPLPGLLIDREPHAVELLIGLVALGAVVLAMTTSRTPALPSLEQ